MSVERYALHGNSLGEIFVVEEKPFYNDDGTDIQGFFWEEDRDSVTVIMSRKENAAFVHWLHYNGSFSEAKAIWMPYGRVQQDLTLSFEDGDQTIIPLRSNPVDDPNSDRLF